MFGEDEKQIFTFDAGTGMRRMDPLAIRRALLRCSGGQFYHWLAASQEPEERTPVPGLERTKEMEAMERSALLSALDAQERTLEVVRSTFNLPAVSDDGTGVPEAVCWRVLGEFNDFMEGNASGGGN